MKLICIYDAHAVFLSRIWFTALFLSQSAVESMLSGLLEEHRVRMEEEWLLFEPFRESLLLEPVNDRAVDKLFWIAPRGIGVFLAKVL